MRRRRRGVLAVGSLVLVAAGVLTGGTASGWIARTNFYQYLPTGWVVKAAGRGSVDAMAIVEARVNADEVKGARMQEVIETGLAAQGAEKLDATTQRWIDLLKSIDMRSGLTKGQKQRFVDQALGIRLFVPAAPTGSRSGFTIRFRARLPSQTSFRFDVTPIDVLIDNRSFWSWSYIRDLRVVVSNCRDTLESFNGPTLSAAPGRYELRLGLRGNLEWDLGDLPVCSDGFQPIWRDQHWIAEVPFVVDDKGNWEPPRQVGISQKSAGEFRKQKACRPLPIGRAAVGD